MSTARSTNFSDDMGPHSRGRNSARAFANRVPLREEGAGNAGRWPHPQPCGQKGVEGPQALVTTGKAERSGIPRAMV